MTAMLSECGTPPAGTAVLHTAAAFGQLDTIRLLLKNGADPDWKGRTPMHFAAANGKADAMALLEQHGARKDAEDVDGKTPAQLLEEKSAALSAA